MPAEKVGVEVLPPQGVAGDDGAAARRESAHQSRSRLARSVASIPSPICKRAMSASTRSLSWGSTTRPARDEHGTSPSAPSAAPTIRSREPWRTRRDGGHRPHRPRHPNPRPRRATRAGRCLAPTRPRPDLEAVCGGHRGIGAAGKSRAGGLRQVGMVQVVAVQRRDRIGMGDNVPALGRHLAHDGAHNGAGRCFVSCMDRVGIEPDDHEGAERWHRADRVGGRCLEARVPPT